MAYERDDSTSFGDGRVQLRGIAVAFPVPLWKNRNGIFCFMRDKPRWLEWSEEYDRWIEK